MSWWRLAATGLANTRLEPGEEPQKPWRRADRYHLVRHLSKVVERQLLPHRKALRQIRFVPASSSASAPVLVRYVRPQRKLRKHRVQQARQDRYECVQALVAQGKSYQRIAQQLHLNRKTVAWYAKARQAPEEVSMPLRAGILAPYTRYLYARWLQGERNSVGLYREIAAQGYPGSRMTVERFLLGLRAMEPQSQAASASATTVELTAHRAVGLLLKRQQERTQEESQALMQLRQLHPDLERTVLLMHHFLEMLRERRGEELDQWLQAAFHSGIAEWRAFVRKIRQDQAAVQAGLLLKWNNGPSKDRLIA